MSYQGYINASNERYRDYYDYYSNKGILRLGYNFTDKLLVYTGFGFEQRRYGLHVGGLLGEVSPDFATLLPVGDIFRHRSGKQIHLLRHHRDLRAQAYLRHRTDIDPVNQNSPLLRVV